MSLNSWHSCRYCEKGTQIANKGKKMGMAPLKFRNEVLMGITLILLLVLIEFINLIFTPSAATHFPLRLTTRPTMKLTNPCHEFLF